MLTKYLSKRAAQAIQLQKVLAIVPFAWFLLFLIILAVGTFKLGHIPVYGNRINPHHLSIGLITVAHAICLVLSFFAVAGWILLTIIFFSFYKGRFLFDKIPLTLFCVGLAGFILFKYGFPSVFAWVIN